MDDEYTLLTPENVALRYDVAGLGSRVAAAALDYVLLLIVIAVLELGGVFALSLLAASPSSPPTAIGGFLSGLAGYGLLGLSILVTFLVWWGYFVLCETLWNGQSVGKKLLHLRVIRANGQPLGLLASLIRNLLRVIDYFLMVGVLVMLIDRSGRRLGDFAAGTLVIREPPAGKRTLLDEAGSLEIPPVPLAQAAALPNAGRLTAAHYAILREFFARRRRLDPAAADALAQRLAAELGGVLAAPTAAGEDPTMFLATALRAYEARHRYDDVGG